MTSIIKFLVIILFISISLLCSNGQGEKSITNANYKRITLQEFLNYKGDLVKQAEMVNSLERKSRMKFFNEFLPDSSFFLGAPDEWFTITHDGLVVVDLEADDLSSTLKFATWSIENNEFVLKSENVDTLGYKILVADDFSFEVITWNKGKKNESKHLILKLKLKKIIPEEKNDYYEYRYIGHGPATEKIRDYYKKKGWKTKY